MKKYMFKTSILSIAVALALGTVGCSSGGGDSTTAVSTTQTGTGIDGILVGSTVCIDVNANNACDTDEDSTVTDVEGKFELTSTQTGALLLVGGRDIGTGLDFTGSLKAPAGSTVITPLTSAVQALVESGSSAVDAEASVQAALGLPDVDLMNFDPLEAVNDANATTAGYAQEVLAKQALLQTIVHASAASIAGADSTTEIADVMDNVFAQIVTNLDDLSVENVAAATKAAAGEVYANNLAAQVSVVSTADDSAQAAVTTATTTEAVIAAAADPVASVSDFDTAILLANTSLEADAAAAAEAAATAAALLDDTALEAIAAAQAEAERVAAEIAAAEQAAADAAAAAQAAEDAYIAAAELDEYNAYLAALVAQEEADAAAAAAAAAAEVAAQEAALLEAQLAADVAAAEAAAQAELDAALAAETAAAELAAAELAAAEDAAAAALAAATLAEAEAAAAAAELAAALDIATTQSALHATNAANSAAQAVADYALVLDISTDTTYNVAAELAVADGNKTLATDAAAAADTSAAAVVTLAAADDVTGAQAEVLVTEGYAVDAAAAAANVATALVDAKAVVLQTDIDVAAAAAAAAAQAELDRIAAAILASQTAIANSLAVADSNLSAAEASAAAAQAAADAASSITYSDAATAVATAVSAAADANASAIATQTAVDAVLAAQSIALATEVTELEAAAAAVDAAAAAEDAAAAAAAAATAESAALTALAEAQAIELANIDAAIDANQAAAAASAADANTSAIAADASADTAEALTNPNAVTYAEAARIAADTAAQAALDAAAASTSAAADNTIDGTAAFAVTAATAAQTAADAAVEAAAQLVLAQDAPEPVASDTTWFEGKQLYSFWIDSEDGVTQAMYGDILLDNGGVLTESEYLFDGTNWTLDTNPSNDDKVLDQSTGSWVTPSGTYVIDANNSIMTINGLEEISIESATPLDGLTVDFTSYDGVVTIPVTFGPGAMKYTTSWRVVTEHYSLAWEPTIWDQNGDTGVAFDSIEAYMIAGNTFYWDEATNTGVRPKPNADNSGFVDSNDVNVTSLVLDMTGPLVSDSNQTQEMGIWRVVVLPGQDNTMLSVVAELNTSLMTQEQYDSYMEDGQKYATLYDGDNSGSPTVYMVELQTVMATSVTDDEDTMGNLEAINDIKAAVADYYSSLNSLLGSWVLDDGDRNILTFIDDTNYILIHEADSPDGDYVAGSAEQGTYSWDGTNLTITVVDDNDGLGGFGEVTGSSVSFPVSTDGTSFTLTVVDGTETFYPQFFKVASTNTMVGSWVLDEGNGYINVLTILSDTDYSLVHAINLDGEVGTYTIDTSDNATFTAVVDSDADTGGIGGFSGTVTEDIGASLTFDDGTDNFTFTRIQ